VSDVSTSDDIDPKSTITYRGAKVAVIVLGVLLLLAFLMVVVGIGMRMSGHAPGQNPTASKFELPAGSKILSLQVVQNRLVMAVQMPRGSRVYIFNADNGQLIGQIQPAGQ
jgi:hypothetical protein